MVSPVWWIHRSIVRLIDWPSLSVYLFLFIRQTAPGRQNIATSEALQQLRDNFSKKEALLNHLHHEVKQGKASKRKEEQLWDVQRQVTELKRQVFILHVIEIYFRVVQLILCSPFKILCVEKCCCEFSFVKCKRID